MSHHHQHTHHGGRAGPQPYQALARRLTRAAIPASWDPSQLARQLHHLWHLRCATVPELRDWLTFATRADGAGHATYRKTFCRDACPAWCIQQRAAGKCTLPPNRSARNAGA